MLTKQQQNWKPNTVILSFTPTPTSSSSRSFSLDPNSSSSFFQWFSELCLCLSVTWKGGIPSGILGSRTWRKENQAVTFATRGCAKLSGAVTPPTSGSLLQCFQAESLETYGAQFWGSSTETLKLKSLRKKHNWMRALDLLLSYQQTNHKQIYGHLRLQCN